MKMREERDIMSESRSFRSLPPFLAQKYREIEGYDSLMGYMQNRYLTILSRFWDTFRYVDPAPENAEVFSYEYGSLLRDIGSVFCSVLDTLIRAVKSLNRELTISDYRSFLVETVDKFETIGVKFNIPFSARYFFPYKEGRLAWWDAYNNVKHSDSVKYMDGCLSNVFYGLASFAIIYELMNEDPTSQQYGLVGFFGEGSEEDIYPLHVKN